MIRALLFVLSFLVFTQTGEAVRKGLDKDKPVVMHADQFQRNHETGMVVARGNVVIIQDDYQLKADVVNYNQPIDVITASGNVELFYPNGEVVFGNYVEITGDFRDGIINHIRVLMNDDAKFAAVSGKRVDGNLTIMDRAAYTACKVCKEDLNHDPLWRLEAQTIHWDEEDKEVRYTDAILKFKYVPVFYMPYMSHPDPTVKRKSGILAPSIGGSDQAGFIYVQPVYFVINDNIDLFLRPIFTTKGGNYLGAKYRQHFGAGVLQLRGSYGRGEVKKTRRVTNATGVTETKEVDETIDRWHIDSEMNISMNKNWRGGAKVVRVGDKTYFRHIPFHGNLSDNILTSRAFIEGFYGRNYYHAQSLFYQGLRATDRQGPTPTVAPLIDVNLLTKPGAYGCRWSLDTNLAVLTRRKGTDVQRLSTKGGFHLPLHSPLGDVYTIDLSLRGDLYHMEDFVKSPTFIPMDTFTATPTAGTGIDSTRGRVFPQAILGWRFPFINTGKDGHVVIEPQASLVLAPNHEQKCFPNEDSIILEPTDIALMQDSRFPGLDRIDDGSRINYGINIDAQTNEDLQLKIYLGQTYSLRTPDESLDSSGFEKSTSDYVGRATLLAGKYFDLSYLFRFDENKLKPRRQEVKTSFGPPELKLKIDYIQLPRYVGESRGNTGKQLIFGASSNFTKGWTIHGQSTFEIEENKQSLLSASGGLLYDDECFQFQTVIGRSLFKDSTIKPTTSVLFRLVFKTVGEIAFNPKFGGPKKDKANSKQDSFGNGVLGSVF
ncbi:MAG: LPS-assembly protein LptD [Alphaproteobacteria bacterium]